MEKCKVYHLMLLMFSVAVFQHYTMGYKKLQKGDNFFKWQKSLYQINRKKKRNLLTKLNWSLKLNCVNEKDDFSKRRLLYTCSQNIPDYSHLFASRIQKDFLHDLPCIIKQLFLFPLLILIIHQVLNN